MLVSVWFSAPYCVWFDGTITAIDLAAAENTTIHFEAGDAFIHLDATTYGRDKNWVRPCRDSDDAR